MPTSPPEPPGPIRTCVGCRRRRPQADLVRVVADGDGSVAIGRTLPGRGAWLCRASTSCLDLAIRRHGLARSLRTSVSATAAAELRSVLGAHPGP
ncbi:MAG: YlxR family protein [Acidimicrobiales bacterium]